MKDTILILTLLNIAFLLMHEFDACKQGEWKMFKILNPFKEETRYQIYLWIHFPISVFLISYYVHVMNFDNYRTWIIVNAFGVIHLLLHLVALKWKSNVFTSISSFIFIAGAALTGAANLILYPYYI
jgi:hypothetical protein